MVSLKGTRTEKNLLIAFAGESQARNRYSFFASKAKDEGYQAISKIFLETAEQEREHASRLFKFMEGGALEITASFPAGKIGTTLENLQAAAYGEHEENTDMYPRKSALLVPGSARYSAPVHPTHTSSLSAPYQLCRPAVRSQGPPHIPADKAEHPLFQGAAKCSPDSLPRVPASCPHIGKASWTPEQDTCRHKISGPSSRQ